MGSSGTAATRWLDERAVEYARHVYDYEERGGAPHAAECLGVALHEIVKTLVMKTDRGDPLLVLMHGDRKVSTRRLARAIGARRVLPCSPEEALHHTGFVVGGICPFGTKRELPVCAESSLLALPRMLINGGRRGLLLEMSPQALRSVLDLREVSVAVG